MSVPARISSTKLVVAAAVIAILPACVASAPSRPIQLLPAAGGPQSAYWANFHSVEGLTDVQRRVRLRQNGATSLPWTTYGPKFAEFWIVSICNGVEKWEGRRYQADADDNVRVSCP